MGGRVTGQTQAGTHRSCVEKLLLYRVSLAYLITKHLYWATWKRRTLRISSVLQEWGPSVSPTVLTVGKEDPLSTCGAPHHLLGVCSPRPTNGEKEDRGAVLWASTV